MHPFLLMPTKTARWRHCSRLSNQPAKIDTCFPSIPAAAVLCMLSMTRGRICLAFAWENVTDHILRPLKRQKQEKTGHVWAVLGVERAGRGGVIGAAGTVSPLVSSPP